jgi:hypothetical protein
MTWTKLSIIASFLFYGIYKMKPTKLKKMFLQNGSFMGVVLLALIVIIKILKTI